jgi:hypothetical protein
VRAQGQPRVSGGNGFYAGTRAQAAARLWPMATPAARSASAPRIRCSPRRRSISSSTARCARPARRRRMGLRARRRRGMDHRRLRARGRRQRRGDAGSTGASRRAWRSATRTPMSSRESSPARTFRTRVHLPRRGTLKRLGTVREPRWSLGMRCESSAAPSSTPASRAGKGRSRSAPAAASTAIRVLQYSGGLGFRLGRLGIDTAGRDTFPQSHRERGVELAAGLALYH